MAALAMAVLYFASAAAPSSLPLARILAALPVALASYRQNDVRPGLVYAAFFSIAFLLPAAKSGGAEAGAALVNALFLVVAVFVFSGVAGMFRTRDAFEASALEHQGLLARAGRLHDVAHFVRQEALRTLPAQAGLVLLHNPAEDRWEAVGAGGVEVADDSHSVDGLGLPVWLAQQAPSGIINDLSEDSRVMATGSLRALLWRTLCSPAGDPVAWLVLGDVSPWRFAEGDLARIEGLARAAESALAQAGAFARTGAALDRLAGQLAAVQRTARELSASLDPRQIADRALACALDVTGAEAGAILASVPGAQPVRRSLGVPEGDGAAGLLDEAARIRQPGQSEIPAGAPALLTGAANRMTVPLRRGGLGLGALIVESQRPEAFNVQDFQALQALADHAAIALDNARLFAEIRREREKSDRIIRSMADGLLVLDTGGSLVSMNPAAESLTGWRAQEAVGRSVCELLQCGNPDECRSACKLKEALRERGTLQSDRWSARDRGGRQLVLGISVAALGGDGGGVVLLRDVTSREELEQFQRELVSTFTHELRAPLTNIDALIAVLGQEAGPDAQELATALRSEGRRLSELAGRTLDVARLDARQWRLEPRPLAGGMLAEQAAARLRRARPDRPVWLVIPRPAPWAWGDEASAAAVLDNLLDNASKYSPAGEAVTLEVVGEPLGWVTFSVEDRGQGVPEGQEQRVFERFFRADGADSRRSYGYGLGLYIARRLVEAMGGRIWLERAAEGGSRFSFTLPGLQEAGFEDSHYRG